MQVDLSTCQALIDLSIKLMEFGRLEKRVLIGRRKKFEAPYRILPNEDYITR
jgi:hypothetical protein